jgi:FtsZ-interacting cell division protein YlmF
MTGSFSADEAPEPIENIRFVVFALSSYEDGKRSAEAMRAGSGVVINGENLDSATYQRVVDFLDGAAHVLGGMSRFVSDTVQIYVPATMEFVDEVGSYYGNLTSGKKRFDG